MSTQTGDYIIQILSSLFPAEAEFRPYDDLGAFSIGIDWGLNDQKNPNKRSKTINLRINRAFLDDYKTAREPIKNTMERNLIRFIRDKLLGFEATHNTPDYKQVPVELWIFASHG